MGDRSDDTRIRTRRLELVTMTASLIEAVVSGDLASAGRELGAAIARSLAVDPSHLVQLGLAERAASAAGYPGVARAVVLLSGSQRRMIGSIGFHGPPDDHGRLEVGCRIHPAHHGRGYGAEATTGLLDWATARFGVTRFLLAVPSRREGPDPIPIVIASRRAGRRAEDVNALAELLEGRLPRFGRER